VQIQLQVNQEKSSIFLEILQALQKDNMVKDFHIVDEIEEIKNNFREALQEVKLEKEGKIKFKSAEEFLDEL
jgi:D-ribose pyranose/furanose isomerase RbsD